MKINRDPLSLPRPLAYPVVALGNFDGVHIGHQMIFRRVAEIARAKNGTGLAFTFQPHPLKVLNPDTAPPLLTSFRKKIELIGQCGIDRVICARFNRRLADHQPRDFTRKYLAEAVGVHLEQPQMRGYLIEGHGLYAWGRDVGEAMRHLEAIEFMLSAELELRRLGAPP